MRYHLRKTILKYRSIRRSRLWLKRIRIKGTNYLSLYRFFKIFLRNIQENEIVDRSNGVAFSFVLAVFPTIIFLFTLIPYIGQYFPAISRDNIMVMLGDYLPTSMYEVVASTVLDILSKQRGGLLTLGFLFALFLATNGMMSLMSAFNACYKTVEKRGFFEMRLTATGLTVFLAIVLLSSVVLLVLGEVAIREVSKEVANLSHWRLDKLTIYGLFFLRFTVIFIVFFLGVSFIYYFGPAVHYNWKFISIGSIFATLTCLLISYGFSFYITNFASYNKVYGSIGALIAFMVWVQLLTLVLLFGYEINAAIHYGQKIDAIEHHKRMQRRISQELVRD